MSTKSVATVIPSADDNRSPLTLEAPAISSFNIISEPSPAASGGDSAKESKALIPAKASESDPKESNLNRCRLFAAFSQPVPKVRLTRRLTNAEQHSLTSHVLTLSGWIHGRHMNLMTTSQDYRNNRYLPRQTGSMIFVPKAEQSPHMPQPIPFTGQLAEVEDLLGLPFLWEDGGLLLRHRFFEEKLGLLVQRDQPKNWRTFIKGYHYLTLPIKQCVDDLERRILKHMESNLLMPLQVFDETGSLMLPWEYFALEWRYAHVSFQVAKTSTGLYGCITQIRLFARPDTSRCGRALAQPRPQLKRMRNLDLGDTSVQSEQVRGVKRMRQD